MEVRYWRRIPLNEELKLENTWAGSLARIGHEPPKHRLAVLPTLRADGSLEIDWEGFRLFCEGKYSESWARRVQSYAQRYQGLLLDPSGLERLSGGVKNNALSSLTALARFVGIYEQFKSWVKAAGIKRSKSSSVDGFLRIMGA